MRDREKKY